MRGRPAGRTVARMTPDNLHRPWAAWAHGPPTTAGVVVIAWGVAVLVLGALAPFADRALSGAGWEAPGSESGQARRAIESHFPGQGSYALSVVVAGERAGIGDRPMRAAVAGVQRVLRGDRAVSGVLRAPAGGHRLAGPPHRDRHRARGRGAVGDGRGSGAPQGPSRSAVQARRHRAPHRPGRHVVRLQPRQQGRDDEVRGAVVAAHARRCWCWRSARWWRPACRCCSRWPGCSAPAACSSSVGQLFDVSIWAMNFAMMFAIALGIDYALFIVVRFRGALAAGLSPRDATVHTMATAGKAVLASGLTVIAALLAVMLVPVPTFRSVPLGIVLAVLSVLAATLTLLPAALSALGHRINGGRIRLRSAGRSLAASASPAGGAGCGRDRCRTAPPRSRSCCFSPRPRSDCGRGCRRSLSCRTMPTHARVTRSWRGRSGSVRRAGSR